MDFSKVVVMALALCAFAHTCSAQIPPPQPEWPSEVHFSVVSELYSMSVNYSYATQKVILGAHVFGENFEFFVDCAKGAMSSFVTSPWGTVCYKEDMDDWDVACPLLYSPFNFFFTDGVNLTYAGKVRTSDNQDLYSWVEGYDDYFGCMPCSFYWETAVYSTIYRTPIAMNDDVWLDSYEENPAGYFVSYSFNPQAGSIQPVKPPKIPCHDYNPPFFGDTSKTLQASTARPADERREPSQKKASLQKLIPKFTRFVHDVKAGKLNHKNFIRYLKDISQ